MRRLASALALLLALGLAQADEGQEPREAAAGVDAVAAAKEQAASTEQAAPKVQAAPKAQAVPATLSERLRQAGRGIASWYGGAFHGKRTASGELYDMHAFTAAHPWLPFGTLVQVTSLVNGRTVTVRINDRGPFGPQRIIDLSRAAAQSLGLVGRGLKPVEIRLAAQPGEE